MKSTKVDKLGFVKRVRFRPKSTQINPTLPKSADIYSKVIRNLTKSTKFESIPNHLKSTETEQNWPKCAKNLQFPNQPTFTKISRHLQNHPKFAKNQSNSISLKVSKSSETDRYWTKLTGMGPNQPKFTIHQINQLSQNQSIFTKSSKICQNQSKSTNSKVLQIIKIDQINRICLFSHYPPVLWPKA